MLGAHKTSDCKQCHTGFSELKFGPLDVDCFSCHSSDYTNAKTPDHVQAGFSVNCQECHSINSLTWGATNVDHSFFPLVGGHSLPNCFSCHIQGQGFSGLSKQCYNCHQLDYQATLNPNHVSAGFPTTCESCHNIYGWQPASFDHDQTNFPLTGQHTTAQCAQCHSNGYSNTPTDCYACHQSDYNNTTNPNHIVVSFPTTCQDCHNTNGWQPATFDHDNQYFPIYTGKHKDKWNFCSDCHTVPSNYAVFSCITCHEHNQTKMNSEHQGVQGYVYESQACYSCHPNGSSEGAFNHSTSNFPLIGQHLIAECSQCHVNGYQNTSSICYDCHTTEYNSSGNPNHIALALSTDCNNCHTPTPNWSPALFPNHNSIYPLLGAHSQVTDCNSCHNGNYSSLGQNCINCHSDDFQNANNPNHTTNGFSTECSNCHNFNAWVPSTFDHDQTNFPLTGQHTTAQCAQCHSNGYSNTPTDCYACHQSDYNNTTNPNHIVVSFPTTCQDCHNTNGWQPATFDHDNQYFPIYTGKHKDKWNVCSDCHTVPSNYAVFSCITCHEHNQTKMNSEHQGVQGYVYESQACYNCHPDGDERNEIHKKLLTD